MVNRFYPHQDGFAIQILRFMLNVYVLLCNSRRSSYVQEIDMQVNSCSLNNCVINRFAYLYELFEHRCIACIIGTKRENNNACTPIQ